MLSSRSTLPRKLRSLYFWSSCMHNQCIANVLWFNVLEWHITSGTIMFMSTWRKFLQLDLLLFGCSNCLRQFRPYRSALSRFQIPAHTTIWCEWSSVGENFVLSWLMETGNALMRIRIIDYVNTILMDKFVSLIVD